MASRRVPLALLTLTLACSSQKPAAPEVRPVDAGPAAPPVWLHDITVASGMIHKRAEADYAAMQGRFAGGVCALDANGDGRLDLLFPGSRARGGTGTHLYLGVGPLRFKEDGGASGLADTGDSGGCVAADFDGDGATDVVVTGLGGARLFRNAGGKFVDESARLPKVFPADLVATSAVAFDADGDGDLDLAIAGYGRYRPPASTKDCLGPCEVDVDQYDYGATTLLLQQPDRTFVDASDRLGKLAEPGLVLLATDLDEDGRIDLFVGNDFASVPDRYFKGDGKGGFVESAASLGVAFAASRSGISSMSAFDGDLDGDGHLDLVQSSEDGDRSAVYRCTGGSAPCAEVGEALELFAGMGNYRWGQALVDLDHDGAPELLEAVGHIAHTKDLGIPFQTMDRPQLWHRGGVEGPFVLQPFVDGLRFVTAGRGLLALDLDDDGDLDVVVGTALGTPLVMENVAPKQGHWLQLSLAADAPNRAAIGARVVVRTGARSFARMVHAGSGFMSSDDALLHFGVGAATSVDVEIHWPDGAVSSLKGVETDARVLARHP